MPFKRFTARVLSSFGANVSPLLPVRKLGSREKWAFALSSAVGLLVALYLIRATAPGLLTNDSSFQLAQALGQEPFNDWHPVIMSVVWSGLISMTGSIGSMAAAQILFAWLCACGLSVFLLRATGRWWTPVVAQVFILLPNTINMWGIVWKDVHLALALVCSIVCLFLIRTAGRRMGWALFGVSVLALIYAVLVRKNAIVIAPPILLAGIFVLTGPWSAQRLRRPVLITVAAVCAFVIAVLGVGKAIDLAVDPSHNSQFTQVMIDDIIFALPTEAVERSEVASPELKEKMLAAKAECETKEAYWDAYWKCYGRGASGKGFTSVARPDEITALWMEQVPKELPRYVDYRLFTFGKLLFTSKLEFVNHNKAFEPLEYPRANQAVESYVVDLGVTQLPWLFHGWFWLLLSLAGLVAGFRARSFVGLCVLAAGVLYLASFIPTVPAQDYRYIFPLVLTTMLGGAIVAIDARVRARGVARSRGGDRLDGGGDRLDAADDRLDGGGDRLDAADDRVDGGGDRLDAADDRVDGGGGFSAR
ncbi:hypothetical protein [Brevibacterium sp.]|uniref:hypothetical protein n=1 Tax=Brevibacterium sp. TaxID=1701 RepID=UPI0028111D73|nr:hypothetical protein [Brevibacterium sp.]